MECLFTSFCFQPMFVFCSKVNLQISCFLLSLQLYKHFNVSAFCFKLIKTSVVYQNSTPYSTPYTLLWMSQITYLYILYPLYSPKKCFCNLNSTCCNDRAALHFVYVGSDFLFLFESVLVDCKLLGICPFYLAYLSCLGIIIHIII
jgi:hypothetical protein